MKLLFHFFLGNIKPKGICITILILCYSIGYAQSALNLIDLYHESYTDSKSLIITANTNAGNIVLGSNTSGISFQAVAIPDKNIENVIISLDFEDNMLLIRTNTHTLYSNLPSWQLLPIVKFVNSPYNVIYSQMGDTTGSQVAQCRFHPAFLNTLLGLRLFQADLLNITDVLWDLPIDQQRRYILATSERGIVPKKDSNIQKKIYEKLENGGFSSFFLTDANVKILFNIDERGLMFSGKPYYYFFNTSLDPKNIQHIRKQLDDCYDEIEKNAKVILKDNYNRSLNPRINLGGLIEALNKQIKENPRNSNLMQQVDLSLNKLDKLSKMSNEEIGILNVQLTEYTESFKSYWELLKQYNPPVYSAVENTFKWSAFFRYIKKVNPNNWASFVEKVERGSKSDAPSVQTPTSYELNYFRYFEEKEKNKK